MNLALILFIPLAGYLFIRFLDKFLPKPWGGVLGSSLIGISFLLSLVVFASVVKGCPLNIHLFTWIATSGLKVNFGLQADSLTTIMMLVVTGVSTIIHVYSIGYMQNDESFNRFFAYLNLFVFFMLLLILADNYLLLFAGWEGVGLCSYLLIGFWYKNQEFAKAANKAFIMNRIGDLGFLLGIAVMFFTFGSLNYNDIQLYLGSQSININQATLIAILLFIGAIGKSAQIPLFTWLPDAMAGPTPVSALIHAATMVTAGVYLVIRSKLLFLLSPVAMDIVAITGIVTALFAATIALKQNDIKKILAYSTVSQLGLMFFALGLGAFDAGLFHLITHAFFKALLFLSAGSVIHALHEVQDIRLMGNLRNKIRTTYLVMVIGALAISGIPPFSGFFSKDSILAAASHTSPILWILALVVSLLTAFYMFRLIYVVFHGDYRGNAQKWEGIHESPKVMTIPLIVLGILSLFGGILNIPEIMGGNEWLSHFIGITNISESHVFIEWATIIVTVFLIFALIYYCYIFYGKKKNVPAADENLRGFSVVLTRKYYVDEIYQVVIVKPLSWMSDKLYAFIELKVVDALVESVGKIVIGGSQVLRYLQSGSVSFYLLFMVLGIIVVLIFNLFF